MKRVTADLEEDLYERLRKTAFDRHESMSDIIREALAKILPPPAAEQWLPPKESS